MNNKNEIIKRAFVPKKIGDSLNNIKKDFSNKFGRIEYIIISKWSEIVGSFFANHSEPEKISRFFEKENDMGEKVYSNTLHVNVSSVAAVEFQHYKDKIIEKINMYFGYKAISSLKIKQNFITNKIISKNKPKNEKIKINEAEIKKETNKIKNKNLENSVVKLGISISNEENK